MIRKRLRLVLALLFAASPAFAQPPRFIEAATAIYQQAHLSSASSDDDKRGATIALAEQMAFEFPSQGWGAKRADAGRPISKDCVARVGKLEGTTIVNGVCYDWINGSSGAVQNPPLENSINGQVFVAVVGRDHLGSQPPPPPPPSGDFVTHAELKAVFEDLSARIAKLEAAGPGGNTPPPTDVALDQLATTKKILELLQKTAARFGVQ